MRVSIKCLPNPFHVIIQASFKNRTLFASSSACKISGKFYCLLILSDFVYKAYLRETLIKSKNQS